MATLKAIWKWPLLAVQFLTITPVPPLPHVNDRDLRFSVLFYPAVGLGLGALSWWVQRAALLTFPPLAAAFLALGSLTMMTGMLHLDGLMDLFDAVGSRKPKDEALAIMKDSRVGALGALAGMLLLLGKFVALAGLGAVHVGLYLLPPVFSRLAMVWAMAVAPSARNQQGIGGIFARKIPLVVVAIATMYSFGLILLWLPWWLVILDGSILLISAGLFTSLTTRRFGGMTGDMYGALNELVEWLFFTLGAMR